MYLHFQDRTQNMSIADTKVTFDNLLPIAMPKQRKKIYIYIQICLYSHSVPIDKNTIYPFRRSVFRKYSMAQVRQSGDADASKCPRGPEHALRSRPIWRNVSLFDRLLNSRYPQDWQLHRTIRLQINVYFRSFAAVLMAEVVKLVTCLIIVFIEEGSYKKFVNSLNSTIVRQPMDTLKVCVPSLVYILQNNLLYVSASNLDAATYQVQLLRVNEL